MRAMSKWLHGISLLIVTWLICSADGCQEDPEARALNEEQYTAGLIDSIRLTFESETVPVHLLRSYEMVAMQKVTDFADYLNLLSDTSHDLKIRQQAAVMARSLFLSGESKVDNWSREFNLSGVNGSDQLVSSALDKGLPWLIKPLNISVREPFTLLNESTFAGEVTFSLERTPRTGEEIQGDPSGPFTAEIWLIRSPKTFGAKRLKVWEVSLGDIR
jgi:hypothetical protein